MSDAAKVVLGAIGVLILIVLISWGLGWFSLIASRPMQKYNTETQAQVYDTSRVYQQGTQNDIARYCEQMETAPSPSAKKAVAQLIRTTVSTYNGPLTQDDINCISEAKGY